MVDRAPAPSTGADRPQADLEAAARILGPAAVRDGSLAPFCTYRVGGSAALLVEVGSVADLELVRTAVAESRAQTLVVGKGSNLLVSDAGFSGIALHLSDGFDDISISSSNPDGRSDAGPASVVAGASALLPVVARKTAAAALTGFEWAVGVPGSIGGAVRMNAGGHGSDMAAVLGSVDVFDLHAPADVESGLRAWTLDDLDLGYRRSAIGPGHVVIRAELLLRPGDAERSGAEISEIVRWRRENQPGGQNAGSVFANPEGDSAGRLIDELGLKGFRVGTAEVSTKHANFIQADPDGSADDVYALIREVRLRVAAATGIELSVENRLVGFESGGGP